MADALALAQKAVAKAAPGYRVGLAPDGRSVHVLIRGGTPSISVYLFEVKDGDRQGVLYQLVKRWGGPPVICDPATRKTYLGLSLFADSVTAHTDKLADAIDQLAAEAPGFVVERVPASPGLLQNAPGITMPVLVEASEAGDGVDVLLAQPDRLLEIASNALASILPNTARVVRMRDDGIEVVYDWAGSAQRFLVGIVGYGADDARIAAGYLYQIESLGNDSLLYPQWVLTREFEESIRSRHGGAIASGWIRKPVRLASIAPLAPELATIPTAVDEFKKYVDEHKGQDEFIGVWTDINGVYTLGIVPVTSDPKFKYYAMVLQSDRPDWAPGQIKAKFADLVIGRKAPGKFWMGDRREQNILWYAEENSIRSLTRLADLSLEFIKVYPIDSNLTASTQMVIGRTSSQRSKYDDFLKCVVVISSTKGQGTGFFVTPTGRIISNAHVVEGDRTVSVRLRDGRTVIGRVLDVAEGRDLALIDLEGNGYPWLVLGDTSDASAGEEVLAMGAPEGLAWSVSRGIISAIRNHQQLGALVQTDAALNHGNSGGPLILLGNGKVIGVNTFGLKGVGMEGLSFAIGAEEVLKAFPFYSDESE